jgi:hypothetical protein
MSLKLVPVAVRYVAWKAKTITGVAISPEYQLHAPKTQNTIRLAPGLCNHR